MPSTFPCPACGGPNEPEAGASRMTCSYCGANLNIPAHLRTSAPPRVEKVPERAAPPPSLEQDAPELLRKAQPIAVNAWNAFALWTWIRRALPACLVIFVLGLCACVALGGLPFILNWVRR